MSFFLLPISLYIKVIATNFFSFLIKYFGNYYYFTKVQVYLYIIFIVLSFLLNKVSKKEIGNFINVKVMKYISVIVLFQFFSMIFSYNRIGDSILNINPIKNFISLLFFIFFIYIHFLVIRLLFKNNKYIYFYLNGVTLTLFILIIVAYIQILYLKFPDYFSSAVSFFGTYFEERNIGNLDYYLSGSYVQTKQRINGFNSEAGYLASQLLIIFVPFILASIKNKINLLFLRFKYNNFLYYFILFAILAILFFAKTSTGILAIFLIIITLWISLPLNRKILTFYLFFLVIVGCYFLYVFNTNFSEILNDYLFDKKNASTYNRAGGTIALIITFLKHIFLGIGWNYHSFYLFEYTPNWSTNNVEYLMWLNKTHSYPILNLFFGLLSEFGLVCVMFMFIYIYRLLKFYRKMELVVRELNPNQYKFIKAMSDSLHYMVFFGLAISLFSFYQWYASMYLISFFFFVVYRQHLKQKYIANVE